MIVIGACFFIFNNASLDALALSIGIAVMFGAIALAFLALVSTERGVSFGIKIVFFVAMLVSGLVAIIARDATLCVGDVQNSVLMIYTALP